MQSEKKTIRQVVVYLAVGGSTALLELAIFQMLYALSPLGPALSNIFAVVIATACNFALNGTVTFRSSSNLTRSIVLYLALFIFNTTFSTVVISWLIDLGFPSLISKLSTMVCIVIWNFFLYKKVVFA